MVANTQFARRFAVLTFVFVDISDVFIPFKRSVDTFCVNMFELMVVTGADIIRFPVLMFVFVATIDVFIPFR